MGKNSLGILSVSLLLAACAPESAEQTAEASRDEVIAAADGAAGATAAYAEPAAEPAPVSDGTAGATAAYTPPAADGPLYESELLLNTRQLITEGKRSGEGYFSADGNRLIYQAELEGDNPFYQIFVRDLQSGVTSLVSPGIGLTTCAWIHPLQNRIIFASTHEDPDAVGKQQREIALRESAVQRGYAWDYDEHYDMYVANADGSDVVNITNSRGYDAEGSFSRFDSRQIGGQDMSRFRLPAMDALYDRIQRLPDGPERLAVFAEATKLALAYMPEKFVINRRSLDMSTPQLVGYRRSVFWQNWWEYVDIDDSLRVAR